MMTELALGRWTVTDVIGSTLPKKQQFDVVIDGEDLRFRSADGSVDRSLPASSCRYDPYGKHNGFLAFGDEAVWLKTESDQAASQLDAALRARYVPRTPSRAPEPDPTGPTLTKTYRATTPEKAAAAMTGDAERYAGLGYALVSQSWAEPNRSGQIALAVGGVIVTLFGLLFLGVFYLAMLIWMVAAALFILAAVAGGEGSLLVTYEHRAETVAGAPVAPAPAASVRERLVELTQLRDEGLITPEEWEAKRAAILGEL